MNDPVVIVSVARTPIGSMVGELSGFAGHQLGSHAIQAAVARAGIAPEQVQEVIMGCVLPAGQGQAPARQATLGAGLPRSTGATTLNKVCGSGMKAAMFAHDLLVAGSAEIVVAGGMESMSNAPYMMLKGRGGYRYGHGTLFDHMALDGLEDAYEKTPNGGGKSMGQFAEDCAGKYAFTRAEQDAYAIESTRRAVVANTDGSFAWEIAPITVAGRKGDVEIARDEAPFKANVDKIPSLKPAFRKDGTVTAATSSSISDGAAALVMMRASTARAWVRSPSPDWSRTPRIRRSRSGSPPRRWARSKSSTLKPAGPPTPWICSKSTRPLRSWPWPPCAITASRMARSMSMGAPVRWVTPSAPPARG